MAQENTQFFVPLQGPGGAGLLKVVLIETVEDSGIFNLTFQESSLDGSTSPSLESGIAAATSRLAGPGASAVIISTDAVPTVQPSAANSGSVFLANRTSTTQTYTLPAAQTAGLRYTFRAGDAGSEILINPIGTDTIAIKATVDQGASIVTAAGAGIKNTAATNVVGDLITLMSNGVSQWVMLGQSGIWAAQ